MAITETPEQAEENKQYMQEVREWNATQEKLKREHEARMLTIKIVEQGRARARTRRVDALERVVVALIKLPSVLVLSVAVPVLVLARREVPQFIQDFLSL